MSYKLIPIECLHSSFYIWFWGQTSKQNETNCWIWMSSARDSKPGWKLPYVMINSKDYYASRVAYYIHYKIDPKQHFVLHKCDNPLCINPDHLFLGTQLDNIKDRNIKNRQAKGEQNHSKLKEKDIIIIFKMHQQGISYREIAKIFNVGKTIIENIINKKKWKHINII